MSQHPSIGKRCTMTERNGLRHTGTITDFIPLSPHAYDEPEVQAMYTVRPDNDPQRRVNYPSDTIEIDE